MIYLSRKQHPNHTNVNFTYKNISQKKDISDLVKESGALLEQISILVFQNLIILSAHMSRNSEFLKLFSNKLKIAHLLILIYRLNINT